MRYGPENLHECYVIYRNGDSGNSEKRDCIRAIFRFEFYLQTRSH